jgi:cytidine deaminase
MSYQVDIPQELRPKIIEYVNKAGKSMTWNREQLVWLLTVYYRYVEKLGRFKTVAEKVRTKMRCGDCREKMLDYFENEIDKWQGKSWE